MTDLNKIYEKPYVIDVLQEINKKRQHLENIIKSDDYKNHPGWHWMEDWLTKTDEEHYKTWDDYCNVCGKKSRYYIKMDFSFCNDYVCSMLICEDCLTQMLDILKNNVKEKK